MENLQGKSGITSYKVRIKNYNMMSSCYKNVVVDVYYRIIRSIEMSSFFLLLDTCKRFVYYSINY